MSIEQAEQLKRELTDKWVVVATDIPELRRFASLTGKVKTVNMNCRALVEFDGPEDIGWYDIDPQFLTVVDAPRPKETKEAKAKPTAPQESSAKTAAKPAAGGSPLDQIRAGGAAKPAAPAGGSPLDAIRAQNAGGGASAAPAETTGGGSPLDQIRAQGGAAAAEPAKEETAATETPKEDEAKPAPTGSPLDQIRAQGGFKG